MTTHFTFSTVQVVDRNDYDADIDEMHVCIIYLRRQRTWNATRRCNDRERKEGSEMHRLSIYV